MQFDDSEAAVEALQELRLFGFHESFRPLFQLGRQSRAFLPDLFGLEDGAELERLGHVAGEISAGRAFGSDLEPCSRDFQRDGRDVLAVKAFLALANGVVVGSLLLERHAWIPLEPRLEFVDHLAVHVLRGLDPQVGLRALSRDILGAFVDRVLGNVLPAFRGGQALLDALLEVAPVRLPCGANPLRQGACQPERDVRALPLSFLRHPFLVPHVSNEPGPRLECRTRLDHSSGFLVDVQVARVDLTPVENPAEKRSLAVREPEQRRQRGATSIDGIVDPALPASESFQVSFGQAGLQAALKVRKVSLDAGR